MATAGTTAKGFSDYVPGIRLITDYERSWWRYDTLAALSLWAHRHRELGGRRTGPSILIAPDGSPQMPLILELLRQRDDRPVVYAE